MFKTDLQKFQFYDKYSRFNEVLMRKETWKETVKRATDYLFSLVELDEDEKQEIFDGIYNMDVMPSMRLVAMAGKAAIRNNACIYNCAYLPIVDLFAFSEVLNLCMSGVGVGFSVELDYVDRLPVIERQLNEIDDRYEPIQYQIQDSTDGWVSAFYAGLNAWYSGEDIEYDYSLIRPNGAILRTKGGRASGPKPLKELLEFSRNLILSKQGEKLSSVDVYDIVCKIGDCVIMGGVRRVAFICLFSYDDEEMLHVKDGDFWNDKPWRSNSNNSRVIERRLNYDEIRDLFLEMDDGSNGEPGIFSRFAANNTIPERRERARFGLNPCQPGFATVLTQDGIRTFDDIDVGSVIWSGKEWTKVVRKVSSGIKPVYQYISSGGVFVGTENHQVYQNKKKVNACDAESFDTVEGEFTNDVIVNSKDVMDGLVVGDGSVHKASNNLVHLYVGKNDSDYFESEVKHLFIKHRPGIHDNDYCWEISTTISSDELPRTYERSIPDRFFFGSKSKKAGFLRGLFSANGTQIKTGTSARVVLKQTSYKLISQVQIMLSSLGIRSYITTNKPSIVEFSNGTYEIKQSYDLNITSDRYRFLEIIGFLQKYKGEKSQGNTSKKHFSGKLQGTNFIDNCEVFDITVDCDEHTYWTGGLLVSNCGEIFLREFEFCNLSSVICRNSDTKQSLINKVRLATLISTIQSTAIKFNGLRQEWSDNCKQERLCGVDLNGQMDCDEVRKPETLRMLRKVAVETNREYADRFGIARGAAITTVKPSGNSGVMLGTSSGIHPRWSRYYIRNVTVNEGTTLYKMMKRQGVPMKHYSGTKWLVGFYEKSPDNAIVRRDLSALDQLDYWKVVKLNYTEHNPSCTIYYKDNEKDDVIQWLFDNQEIVGGLSFFPSFDAVYENAPYVEITKEQYEQAEKVSIDFSTISEFESYDYMGNFEFACSAGQCDFKL